MRSENEIFHACVSIALVIAVEILFEAFSASKRLERKARPVTASSDFFYRKKPTGNAQIKKIKEI
uniref:hypothetical protein n=1 Tax=Flavobacterium sp. TaxID=239 RepID=UPI00404A305E